MMAIGGLILTYLSIGSIILTGLWWVLNNTVVKSISLLRSDLTDLKDEVKRSNETADNHEIRLTKLETWKHDKWEV